MYGMRINYIPLSNQKYGKQISTRFRNTVLPCGIVFVCEPNGIIKMCALLLGEIYTHK